MRSQGDLVPSNTLKDLRRTTNSHGKFRILVVCQSYKELPKVRSQTDVDNTKLEETNSKVAVPALHKNRSLRSLPRSRAEITLPMPTQQQILDKFKTQTPAGSSTMKVKKRIDFWKKQKPALQLKQKQAIEGPLLSQSRSLIRQIKSENLLTDPSQLANQASKLKIKVRNPFQREKDKQSKASLQSFKEASIIHELEGDMIESQIFGKAEESVMSDSQCVQLEEMLAIMR